MQVNVSGYGRLAYGLALGGQMDSQTCAQPWWTSKPANSRSLGHFSYYCPFKEGYFSYVNLEMGVHIRL